MVWQLYTVISRTTSVISCQPNSIWFPMSTSSFRETDAATAAETSSAMARVVRRSRATSSRPNKMN